MEKCYPPEWEHDPENGIQMVLAKVPYRETWEAMEMLKEKGLVKNIGATPHPHPPLRARLFEFLRFFPRKVGIVATHACTWHLLHMEDYFVTFHPTHLITYHH
jgi:diketogulonate reductase-like aldo/keto reductase